LALGGHHAAIEIRDVDTGKEITIIRDQVDTMPPPSGMKAYPDTINSVAFSPDDQMLASSGYDCAIKIWRVSNGEKMFALRGHSDRVLSLAFNKNGTILAFGCNDGTIRLWRMASALEKKGG
jgi:WD40 repeat protein